uniref:Secreted protein n=1 Tax=Pyxicephalus adspersus TaxID=30357 RepID=A0AAV3A9V1_PYXAD|nr:TPA: hypothetical protein GDO54_017852 [Pyxicephalus adspersus]
MHLWQFLLWLSNCCFPFRDRTAQKPHKNTTEVQFSVSRCLLGATNHASLKGDQNIFFSFTEKEQSHLYIYSVGIVKAHIGKL